MTENTVERGKIVAELVNKRNEVQKKLDTLTSLLEDRKISVEEYNTLKQDYRERSDKLQKEINLLSGIKKEPTPQPYEEKKSSGIAAILSFFFVGLGQIYNGQIGKGILLMVVGFIAIFASVTVVLSGELVGFLIYPIFWLINIHDAYETAQKINLGEIKT